MHLVRHRIDAQDCPWTRGRRTGARRPQRRSRVPLRRKRPAGTRGSGDIDEPSAVTGRARSIGDHAASEIDAPGPRLTPTCGGRTRRPRTEEWPLPDDHPRSGCQLGALDPRSPITEEGSTTVPLPPPSTPMSGHSFSALITGRNAAECGPSRPFVRTTRTGSRAHFGPFSVSLGPLSPTQPNHGHFGTVVEKPARSMG